METYQSRPLWTFYVQNYVSLIRTKTNVEQLVVLCGVMFGIKSWTGHVTSIDSRTLLVPAKKYVLVTDL